MLDYLSGLGAGVSKAQAANHVIQSSFQQYEKVFSGATWPLLRLNKKPAKLSLQNTVAKANLLLFPQLKSAIRNNSAPSALRTTARRNTSLL
jgi:hypothetical protein